MVTANDQEGLNKFKQYLNHHLFISKNSFGSYESDVVWKKVEKFYRSRVDSNYLDFLGEGTFQIAIRISKDKVLKCTKQFEIVRDYRAASSDKFQRRIIPKFYSHGKFHINFYWMIVEYVESLSKLCILKNTEYMFEEVLLQLVYIIRTYYLHYFRMREDDFIWITKHLAIRQLLERFSDERTALRKQLNLPAFWEQELVCLALILVFFDMTDDLTPSNFGVTVGDRSIIILDW